MSRKEILDGYLKGLDEKYENVISFLEQRRQESLQNVMKTINNQASKCRRTIDTEYRNEREKIKQQLFQLQMESHVVTHQQNNEIISKSSRKRLNPTNTHNTNEQDDSDCDSDIKILSAPPEKKHKSNQYNRNNKFSIKKKKRFEDTDTESDSEHTDSSSDFESDLSSKRKKKIITNRSHNRNHNRKKKRKQKRMLENEYEYDDDQNMHSKKSRKKNKKRKKSVTALNNGDGLTAYYRTKQAAVKQARKRFQKLRRNENGKIVIKLPIETVCSEYKAKRIYVTDFGKIPKNPTKAAKYCDGSYIYPIGYKAYRIHLSYENPRQITKYFMEIKDNGMKGPMYEVYAADDRKNKKYKHSAATKPWEDIIDKISKKAKEKGIENKKDGLRETHGTSGPRYLGLRDYMIMGIVELLPNAENCTKYWTAKKHKHNIPPKPFFPDINTNDIIIQ